MIVYLLRRVLYAVPIALAVSIVCFLLVHLAPGDPVNAICLLYTSPSPRD